LAHGLIDLYLTVRLIPRDEPFDLENTTMTRHKYSLPGTSTNGDGSERPPAEEILKPRFEAEPSSLSNDADPANDSKSFEAEALNRVNDSEGNAADAAGRERSARSERTDLSGTAWKMGKIGCFPALLSL
jgi:hypothetical protein